jgi:hypothetical protein
MKVSGKSTRFIECKNRNDVYVRYPISEAVANRAIGNGGTGVVMKIPTTIPDAPTECKVSIAVVYEIFKFRNLTEYAESNTFTLLPQTDKSENDADAADVIQQDYSETFEGSPANNNESRSSTSGSSLSSGANLSTGRDIVVNPERDLDPQPQIQGPIASLNQNVIQPTVKIITDISNNILGR